METFLSIYGLVGLIYGLYKIEHWDREMRKDAENTHLGLTRFFLFIVVLPLMALLWPLVPFWERWERNRPERERTKKFEGKIIDDYIKRESQEEEKKLEEQREIDDEVDRRIEWVLHLPFGEKVLSSMKADPAGTARIREQIRRTIEEEKRHPLGWRRPVESVEDMIKQAKQDPQHNDS